MFNKSAFEIIIRRLPWLFFVLAFMVYSNTLMFTNYVYDDILWVKENVVVQKGISAFHDLVFENSLMGYKEIYLQEIYRPVEMVSLALEVSLFGMSAQANHFFNVFYYALLCMLVFIFLRKIFVRVEDGKPNGEDLTSLYLPAMVTALFTLHPIHTEVVANIKSRDELLCMLFGILSMNFIFDYCNKNKIIFLLLSCIAFFLSALSKESGIVFAALVPLTLFFFTSIHLKRILTLTLPFIVVAAIVILIRISVLDVFYSSRTMLATENSLMAATNLSERLATNFTLLFYALRQLFFPVRLSCDYSYNQFPIVNWGNGTAILSLLIYIGLSAIAVVGLILVRSKGYVIHNKSWIRFLLKKTRTKNYKLVSYAILFYFISYFMTSNLVMNMPTSFGERNLFTPSLAFCIALPCLLPAVYRFRSVILFSIFFLFAIRIYTRNEAWKSNLTLFGTDVQTAPDSWRLHQAYALALRDQAKVMTDTPIKRKIVSEAVNEYRNAMNILPAYLKNANMYYNEGIVQAMAGDTSAAFISYEKALQLTPDYIDPLITYANLLLKHANYREAIDRFLRILELPPPPGVTNDSIFYGKIYYKTANAFFNLGNLDSAAILYQRAIDFYPDNANAINDYDLEKRDAFTKQKR